VDYCGETQLVLNGETFFQHKIWGFETKKLDFLHSHYQVSNLLPPTELQKARELFLSLPKAEYLRVDGRLNEQGFYVLELSADCYLGPNSDFSILFESMGKTHSDFLHYLAENALST
jgi:D-alanine-D-alanine ligase